MGRPSIFSREYNRKMRVRRMKNLLLIFIVIISAGIFLFRSKVMTWVNNKVSISDVSKTNVMGLVTSKVRNVLGEHKGGENANLNLEKNNENKIGEKEVKSTKNTSEESKLAVEQQLQMTLNNGKSISLIYEEIEDKKKFKGASGENGIYFNISPSGNSVIILDESNQDMFLVNYTGLLTDITKKQYISTSGQEIYNKEAEISKVPEYIWHGTPKFIDEENIVYISNLPWFNKMEEKFIWRVNLSTYEHMNILRTGATNLSFDKLTENGLIVNIDGRVKYIQQDGKIVE